MFVEPEYLSQILVRLTKPETGASPVTTNHAAKGSVFVNFTNPGNFQN